MKTSENGKYLKPSKSMFFVSLIFSFLPGYVSASGTLNPLYIVNLQAITEDFSFLR